LLPGWAWANDPTAHFETHVRPLLVERCFGCHSEQAKKSKGGLQLDNRAAVLKGGDSGPAIVVGKPAESLLIKSVRREDADLAMPPTGKPLTAVQIKHLEQWITDGAVYPGGAKEKPDPRKHWAFQPLKPTAPPPTTSAWSWGPVDQFVLAKLAAAQLAPAENADVAVRARRLSFALVGLPPTPADLDEVLKLARSDEQKAFAHYTDKLLASPHFGERWARHWLDLVRYADGAGHEYDYELHGAWRYRDYVVRALNTDLRYDTFIREHIAGDLVPPRVVNGRNEALLATAWWNLGEAATSPVDLPNDEADRLDNRLDVLGKTFTALTVGCARCHDHKFDPLPTREYYGLFGIAAGTPLARTWANGPALDAVAAQLRKLRDARDAQVGKTAPMLLPAFKFEQGEVLADLATGVPSDWHLDGFAEVVDAKSANLRGELPGLWSGLVSTRLPANVRSPQFTLQHDYIDVLVTGYEATAQVVVGNLQLIREPSYEGLRKKIKGPDFRWVRFNVGRWKGQRVHVEVFSGTVDAHHRILHTTDNPDSYFGLRAVLLTNGPQPPKLSWPKMTPAEPIAAMKELEKTIPKPERFLGVTETVGRDVPVYARGEATKPKPERVPRQALSLWADRQGAYRQGSGRRALAEALVAPTNPLTARVLVNRVWHHLFGRGIVATVDNFGTLGALPTHPELLDYLADRFVKQHQWSVKALIRELVLSHAFHTASGPTPTNDAENLLLSRYPLRRLEAEAVRDTILAVAGLLDPKLAGPTIAVPHRLKDSGSDSGNNTPPDGPIDGERRRSLYLAQRRNFPSTFLDIFDKPSSTTTFGRRDVSTVPAQALTLLNDPLVHLVAKEWAQATAKLEPTARVRDMYRAAFARWPTEAEQTRALKLTNSGPSGWHDLALGLLNAKELIYVP
jgi:hypothetical protein